MQKFIAREKHVFGNGAIGWSPGGPFDCLGPYAKVENCPLAGTHLRRTCYATGYADTYFSVPACTRLRGKCISGYFSMTDGNVEFVPYTGQLEKVADLQGLEALEGKPSLEDLYRHDPLQACKLALRRTAHIAGHETRMDKINALLGMHGVEGIRGEWQNGCWCDIVATYCNAGDTYNLTIICQRGDCGFHSPRFFVSTLGSFVERNEKKLGIQ